ncbi:MAG: hypothetical protein M1834_007134 [Cirrosporium novae-zelandiae]|nr:MAG: hypothetical protein M1834_007134 [Cirrosporium novae-zelandiae]
MIRKLSQRASKALVRKFSTRSRRPQSSTDVVDDSYTQTIGSFPQPPQCEFNSAETSGPQKPLNPILKATPSMIATPVLRVFPEFRYIDDESPEDFWVGIEVALELPQSDIKVCDQVKNGLQIAIIIDNSFFTSPNALQAAKDISWSIANSCAGHDKLAMFIVHNSFLSPPPRMQLQNINLSNVRQFLDALVVASKKPAAHQRNFEKVLRAANKEVLQGWNEDTHKGCTIVTGHVIVISSRLPIIKRSDYSHHIQIHTICPGVVRWHGSPHGLGDGSHFGPLSFSGTKSGPSHQLGATSKANATDATVERQNIIEALLCDMHLPVGGLKNLNLRLSPAPGCYFNVLIGDNVTTLNLGQKKFTAIRVHIDLKTVSHSHSAAMLDVEELLGRCFLELLTAELTSSHTSLSGPTILKTSQTCFVEKIGQQTAWSNPEFYTSDKFEVAAAAAAETHKRLAQFLACEYYPREALDKINNTFDELGGLPETLHNNVACKSYIKRLVDELTYQIRIGEQLGLPMYGDQTSNSRSILSPTRYGVLPYLPTLPAESEASSSMENLPSTSQAGNSDITLPIDSAGSSISSSEILSRASSTSSPAQPIANRRRRPRPLPIDSKAESRRQASREAENNTASPPSVMAANVHAEASNYKTAKEDLIEARPSSSKRCETVIHRTPLSSAPLTSNAYNQGQCPATYDSIDDRIASVNASGSEYPSACATSSSANENNYENNYGNSNENGPSSPERPRSSYARQFSERQAMVRRAVEKKRRLQRTKRGRKLIHAYLADPNGTPCPWAEEAPSDEDALLDDTDSTSTTSTI